MTVRYQAIAVAVAATVLQAVMLIAFAWPASELAPRDLPVAVSGPGAAAMADGLRARDAEAFDIVTVVDAAAAHAAITDREAYGAIVTDGGAPTVLIASAASPAVAQQLTRIAQQLSGAPVPLIEDVVPTDPDDAGGGGFAAMVLPLVVSSLAAGYLLSLAVPSIGARLAGLGLYAAGAGLSSAAIVATVLSLLPGPHLALAGVIGLVSVAVSATIVAAGVVSGRIGLGIGGLTFLLLGNPLSAASTGPEMLPRPWGTIGQLLPPGAGASLLRSVAFFDGAAALAPTLVLLTWTATALAVLTVAALRPGRSADTSVPEPVSVA
ncbi:hypothetical protein OHA40_31070 [Nocardia sp. NBC_00508]|uniref:hypothetical protein n=1 Tax=Nocardia sp. NBC_00508 TaxID=2975992 RepID=UPI002E80EE1B|nr:hypothetical protein [Nocardia sp. NBC_00508]WUD65971.1 hypothetical protein OHA40_31070 [Nocardia sp. NBC_00508]